MKTRAFFLFVLLISITQSLFAVTPAITSFSPSSGPVGTLVTITGTALDNPTAFNIGGKPAIIISNTGTKLVGMVMPGAATGGISLGTSGGTSAASGNFTVTSTLYPKTQQGLKLVGTGNIGTYLQQGNSVTISADGNTAVVGASGDNTTPSVGGIGAAFVYIRTGNTWTQQAKLVGTGVAGQPRQSVVSISADGNTVAIGGPMDNNNVGAVWIFVRTGSTWAQQGDKLVGTGGIAKSGQGNAVSLSANGNTLAVGGYTDNAEYGAVWIFIRNNGTWTQQGSKIIPSDNRGKSDFGYAVALNADGNTLVIGGQRDYASEAPYAQGATWVFTRSGSTWSQQGSKLIGTGGTILDNQGISVAVSADGNTLITGGTRNVNPDKGAAWVFTRNGNTWTQQGAMLVGSGQIGDAYFGSSVALSADGNTAVIGASYDNYVGACTVFTRAGNTWTQRGEKLIGSGAIGASRQGTSVAISADGTTMIEGGSQDNQQMGAAWVFTSKDINLPVIASISPSSGPVGTLITITGTNLNNPTAFSIGGKPAIVISNTGTKLVGMVMPGTVTGGISVTTSDGTAVAPGNFTVTPTMYPDKQQGTKLVGTGSIGTHPQQGASVDISADGNTAVVGGPSDDPIEHGGYGAAWVYIRTGYTWTQQAKLTGTGNIGPAYQGGVSISADGNTIALGGGGDNNNRGAVWIFTRTGNTWTQQGNKLVGTNSSAMTGQSAVSLSADGNTLAVGGPYDSNKQGAIWIFVRKNGIWSQQGSKLRPNDQDGKAYFGGAVALSADGNTLVTGGFNDHSTDPPFSQGATWVFTRTGTTWSQQGNKLVGTGGSTLDQQGNVVAISADGNTILVGGAFLGLWSGGAAWVFTRSGGTWIQQGSKLVGNDQEGEAIFGSSVSLSADGNTAAIGAIFDNNNLGAVTVFRRTGSNWAQQGKKLVGTGSVGQPNQGLAISLSADGATMIEGGWQDNQQMGAAWVFTFQNVNPPAITSFSPSSGAVGSLVTITGSNLNNSTAFSIGGKPAVIISNTDTQLVGMVMPSATTGAISVTHADGTASAPDNFTVTPTLYPNTQQGNKLVGTGNTGAASQGYSVAVSADGNTAVVGANTDNSGQGAAWVYIQSGGNWVQQGNKLVGTGNQGAAKQGSSVAISADGNTIAIGGIADHGSIGATWIFTRTAGVWAQQGNKIVGTGNVGASKQGLVSLSADGNTLAVGGSADDQLNGAVWMFTRTGNTWTQQGAKLVGTGFSFNAEQGKVALSADGNTAVVGGYMDGGDNSNNHGAAWIFVRNGGVWSQQGDRLIGAGGSADAAQGSSVAISADGNTVIIGGYNDKNNIAGSGFVGAAWVFTRTGTTWTQQGSKFAGTAAAGEAAQGWSVALSADGNTAMIGGKTDNTNQGAIWVFKRVGSAWAQQGVKLIGTGNNGNAQQGTSLAMNADGRFALVGGPGDNSSQGAVWAFNYVTPPPPPTISSISAILGRAGTLITITGTNLSNPIAFNIAGAPAVIVSNTGTKVVGMVMPGAATGKVTLITTGGTANSTGNFTANSTLYSYFQQGTKLSGSGNTGHALQGFSSAVSADGNTAIVGGYTDNNGQGTAWIFTRTGNAWTQQDKLTGTGNAGAAQQGFSVGISADGNTAIIGGNHDNNGQGAAWVFTRAGSNWTQQGNKLTGSGGSTDAGQGSSVSLSADGNTAVVGAPGDNSSEGALWVYTRINGAWTQQGNKLTGTGNTGTAGIGSSAAISANGTTIITGGAADNNAKGAIWIFAQTNGTWSQQGNRLVGSGGTAQAHQGSSVAINADGSTVVEGGIQDNNAQGAVWVFGKNGTTWTQQGAKLVGTGNTGQAHQGSSVTISADGNTIIEGGANNDGNTGASWTFNRSGSNWLQQGEKLIGSGAIGNSQQGSSVALSADGRTVIQGGAGDNSDDGATWMFTVTPQAAPAIASFSPASGEVGTLVTVNGSNLLNLNKLSIGGVSAIVISNTDSQVTALVMPGAITGSISLSTSSGSATSSGNFTVTHNTPHPYAQVGSKLPGTGQNDTFFAYALAISADSKTAAVSMINDNNAQGGVYIYTKTGNTWTQQGNKLIGNAASVNAEQGFALSISADGNTLLAGSLGGSVWVFTRTGTTWSQQGPKLTGTGTIGPSTFGNAVSLSANGNTALIGGSQDNDYQGAIWIFKRTGATWAQVGGKLTGSGIVGNATLGTSVALSADGNTAVAGGPYDNGRQGAVWIFTNNNGVWSQLGTKISGTGPVGPFIYQGNAVAISADGKTLAEGGYEDNQGQGAVWVFTRSDNTFSQQGNKLVGTGGIETVRQGSFIAISADGNTIASGAPLDNVGQGALWTFKRTGTTWTQLGSKFKGTGNTGASAQGGSVALSADGSTIIEGGYSDNNRVGAMWTFNNQAEPPTITSVDKETGMVGTLVTITGTNLDNPISFSIGGKPAIIISNTGTQLAGMVMPGAVSGTISLTTSGGTATSLNNFTVTPNTPRPYVQVGNKLPGTGTTHLDFATSLAISADGKTAAVGVPYDNGEGGALIFTKNGNTWTQQGNKLLGSGAPENVEQGDALSLSADGNTLLLGSIGSYAWVFVRDGTTWVQQGPTLKGSGGIPSFGGVSLSADGNTALMGDPSGNNGMGSAWMFKRTGTTWTNKGTELTGGISGDAAFGTSVALSADGNTAVLGAPNDNDGYGSITVFANNAGTWMPLNILSGSGNIGRSGQGGSVAISADGNTVAEGGRSDNQGQGAVWVFTRNGNVFSQQGTKLVGTGAIGNASQGYRIAMSADGNTILSSAAIDNDHLGSLWTFTRTGTTWTQLGSKLRGTGNTGKSQQGAAVALTPDGTTMIEGGPVDNNGVGAMWTFNNQSPPPAIASIAKLTGPVGTLVTITGTNLDNPTAFTIGGVPAITISSSGTRLVGMVMPGAVTGNISVSTASATATSTENFTVTPTLFPRGQMGEKLAATSNLQQGWSVALSADGTTAIVGIRNYGNGLGGALIFTRSGNTWTKSATLQGGTAGNSGQGVSVAISADGNTALVGGDSENNGQGAAWVFTRNNGTWTQQGPKLVGTGGTTTASQGESVSLSADGNTAIIGGPSDNSSKGAVWVFKRYESTWVQYGNKLVASGNDGSAALGNSVALSADGATIIAGGESDDSGQGAAWIYTLNNGLWLQQGSKLVGTGGADKPYKGLSVAINANGNTAIMGGPGDNSNQGAIWVFTRTGTTWSQQGTKLIATGNIGAANQGWSVAISADGNTALEGGYSDNNQMGATWVFTRNSGIWTQQDPKLVGTGAVPGTPNQGRAVALSADGNTAMEGGFGDNGGFGAVWTFLSGKIPQIITFTPFQPVNYGLADFAIPAKTTNNTIPVTYSISDTTVAKIINNKIHVVSAGTTVITASQAGNDDYAPAPPVEQTLTVNKVPLTVVAKNVVGLINRPLPVLGIRYIGFVNGETDSVLTTLPVTATTATASSPAGDYTITVGGAVSPNYSFTYVTGTLTLSTTTNVPVISSFTPVTGTPGKLVSVTGSHLDNLTGFTIGGVPALVISNSGTKIVGLVMPGATTGTVSVTTATNTATGPGVFTVTPTPHPSGQQGNKLTASGFIGQPLFGASVDVDAEAFTAVIGAPGDNNSQGAIYIFNRTGSLWSQTIKLVGTGAIGAAKQGSSVAISADGNTIIEGGSYDDNSQGAAWIFTRNNDVWFQQGSKLTGTGGIGQTGAGAAVALSGDGNTAVIAGNNDNSQEGAVWVFNRSNSTWAQQGTKLVGTGNTQAARQGSSVAISEDGNTIAEGGSADNSGQGAVWIFGRSGSTWSQQGSKLVGTGNTGPASQGSSVALSADGNILLSAGTYDDSQHGAVWTFKRNGTSWMQRGAKFSGADGLGSGRAGTSVALTSDGTVTAFGAPLDDSGTGGSWVLRSNDSLWVQQLAKRIGTGGVGKAAQGTSVSISSNGKIAITGGPADNNNQGAIWIYSAINIPAPQIASFSPASGPVGTLVTITGQNLGNIRTLKIGNRNATVVSSTDSTITATVVLNATTGPILLTNDGGSASSTSNFIVTTPALQTITFAPLAATVYGAADVVPNATSTDTSLPVVYSSSNTKVASIVNNKIHITGAGNTNITASQGKIATAAQPFTVSKALLTIAADNQTQTTTAKNSFVKQAALQKLTVKYSGFVNNDNEEKLTTKPMVISPADDGLPAGTYPITVSGAAADNYTFNYIPGMLTVSTLHDILTDITKVIIPYPNPFQTVIKLNLGDDNIREVSIQITSVLNGKLVYSKNYADQAGVITIDASNFSNGVYALKLTCNQWQKTYKIFKK